MGNIFKSKEIYKRIKTSQMEKDSLIPIRGLYVVGDYSPPYYIQPTIAISEVKTTKATVVDFGSDREEINEDKSLYGILDLNITNNLHFIRYNKENTTSYEDKSLYGILDLNVSGGINIVRYGRKYDSSYEDKSLYGILDLNVSGDIVRIKHPTNHQYTSPEPSIRIVSVITTKADVINDLSRRSDKNEQNE